MVVSKEIEKGGFVVNDVWEKKGLNLLVVYVIDIVVEKDGEFVYGKYYKVDEKMSFIMER